jgi:hypothetical protein
LHRNHSYALRTALDQHANDDAKNPEDHVTANCVSQQGKRPHGRENAAPAIMQARALGIAAVAVCACATATREPQPVIGARLGSTHVVHGPPETAPDQAAPEIPTIESEAESLARAVEDLEDHRGETRHTRIIVALRALGDAVALLTQAAPDDVRAIRRAADALARAPEDTHMSAELVRLALDGALHALNTIRPPLVEGDASRFDATLDNLATTIGAIDPDIALLHERPTVIEALRFASDAVTIIVGGRLTQQAAARDRARTGQHPESD